MNRSNYKMPIQKFGNPIYNNYRTNTYSNNHILLNSSGESLTSSQYSFKNGSTSSNCSSNDDSPIVNGINSITCPYQNTVPPKHKHFAQLDMDNLCDKNTAQNKIPSLSSDYNGHFDEINNELHVDVNDQNYSVLYNLNKNTNTSTTYEKIQAPNLRNDCIFTISNVNNVASTSELKNVSSICEYPSSLISTILNNFKDDESTTPLLYSKPKFKMDESLNEKQKNVFLKKHIKTTFTPNSPTLEDNKPKTLSTYIMIDEDDQSHNLQDNILVNQSGQNQYTLNTYSGSDLVEDKISNYGATSNVPTHNDISSSQKWEREIDHPSSSAIHTRPYYNTYPSLELGMGSLMTNTTNLVTMDASLQIDQPIQFFNHVPFSNSHNSNYPHYDGYNLNNVEMKVLKSVGNSTMGDNDPNATHMHIQSDACNTNGVTTDADGRKRSRQKKKKPTSANCDNSSNNSTMVYPMDSSPSIVACTYPQNDDCNDKGSNNPKLKKGAIRRKKLINKNVMNEYVAKDDRGKKDINAIVAYIEGIPSSQPSSAAAVATAFKDYNKGVAPSNGRAKDFPKPSTHHPVDDDEEGSAPRSLASSTFSMTTLVEEKTSLSDGENGDGLSLDTISEGQSPKSQHNKGAYKTMKKHYSSEDLGSHVDTHLLFHGQQKSTTTGAANNFDESSTKSDEDYSTPPQDFQENFQIVQKKQYRKEAPLQPSFEPMRGKGTRTNAVFEEKSRSFNKQGGVSGGHVARKPQPTNTSPRSSKDTNTEPGNMTAPQNKAAPPPMLNPADKALDPKTENMENAKTHEFCKADRLDGAGLHHAKPSANKPESFGALQRDRNRNNGNFGPKNYRNKFTNSGSLGSNAKPQGDDNATDINVESFNPELDFPALVGPPKASNNPKPVDSAKTPSRDKPVLSPNPVPNQFTPPSPQSTTLAVVVKGSQIDETCSVENKADPINPSEIDDTKFSYAAMLSKSNKNGPLTDKVPKNSPVPPVDLVVEPVKDAPTTMVTNPDFDPKSHDPSIVEVCQRPGPGAKPARLTVDGNPLSAPFSPGVVFANLAFGRDLKDRAKLGNEGRDRETPAVPNFTFGFDIDSQEVLDIINGTDETNTAPDEPDQPSAQLLESLEVERKRMDYLAPYFANIWSQMQKVDPSLQNI